MGDEGPRRRSVGPGWDVPGGLALVGVAWICLVVPGLRSSALRVLVGLGVTLFAPGYAILAALTIDDDHLAIGVERAVLAVGLSVAVTILVGTALGAVSAFSPVTALAALSVVTVGGLVIAAVRRPAGWIPQAERIASGWSTLRTSLPSRSGIESTSTRSALIWTVLVAGLLVGASGVVYLAGVHQPDGYTEFALRNASGTGIATGGDAVDRGVTLHVENHERSRTTYTVVAVGERVAVDGGSVTVTDRQELRRFSATVDRGAEWRTRHDPSVGERERVTYLLYRGEAPADPSRETAVLALHHWVNDSDGTRGEGV